MTKKVAITTESAADLSKKTQKELDVSVMPLTVLIADEEYRDGVDLTTGELYEKSELYSAVPKTAGISPHDYKVVFEALCEKGFDVVHVALSSKLSSCFQNASFAANGFENVFVVDSLNLSAGMALLVFEAARLRDEGKSAKEIASSLEKLKKKVKTSFVLDDIDFLKKGGRCTAAEKLAADLFSLHPSVDVVDGELIPGKKFRGKELSAKKKYIEEKLRASNPDKRLCFLNYSAAPQDEVDELSLFLKKAFPFEKVIASEAGCTISSHCGKGCAGIIFSDNG